MGKSGATQIVMHDNTKHFIEKTNDFKVLGGEFWMGAIEKGKKERREKGLSRM